MLRDKAATGKLPKGIIVVDLYGQSADMDPILAAAAEFCVPVLEDAAEALGASYRGRPAGSFGDVGVFSVNENKIITTSGGGMLVSRDPNKWKKPASGRTQARDAGVDYEHSKIGYNYRTSNILAGCGPGATGSAGPTGGAKAGDF